MSFFYLNENCIKCGLCAKLCPSRIICFEKGRLPWIPEENEGQCIECGHCVCFCPQEAFFLTAQTVRATVDPSLKPTAESAEVFLRSRRSIRRFKKETLPEELVARLLETVRYAPSAVNSQLVRWVVTRDRSKTVELGALTAEALQRLAASDPDNPRYQKLAAVAKIQAKGTDIIFRGAPQLAAAVIDRHYRFTEDAAIALTYFELAAHAHGVGCCWAGFFTTAARQDQAVKEALGIKENEIVIGAQMFGFPDRLPPGRFLPNRKKPDLTWF